MDCIFCKIMKGEIPSTCVYEDENFKAIMDIAPAAKGHVILVSKKHFANLFEMDDETAKELMPVIRKVGTAVKKALQCDGLNVLQNNGVAAGQTIFHYHVHFVPRLDNDNVNLEWEHLSYTEGEAQAYADKIKATLQ